MQRLRYLLLTLAGVLLIGAAVAYRWSAGDESDVPALRERVAALECEVARARAPRSMHAYQPRVAGSIADLNAPAPDILRQLPGVARVEVQVSCPRPRQRIIHFRDWHFVPRARYAAGLTKVRGRAISPEELDLYHRELALQAELATSEQAAALRCLATHHSLRHVHCAEITVVSLPAFREAIGSLCETSRALAALHKRRAGLKHSVEAIDREIAELVMGQREQLLPHGVAGVLASEQIAAVLPLDDEEFLEAARPVRPDGSAGVDPETLEARQDVQVLTVRRSAEPVAVIVLGAAHDLSAAIARHGGGIEYIQVTTAAVERFAGKDAP